MTYKYLGSAILGTKRLLFSLSKKALASSADTPAFNPVKVNFYNTSSFNNKMVVTEAKHLKTGE